MDPIKLSDTQLEIINSRLADLFGIDTVTTQPMWRIVWSDDQYEMRETDCTDAGILLLHPEVRLLPKYKQWIQQRYILERLVAVPDINLKELAENKISYEIIYVIQNGKKEYITPELEYIKFIINLVLDAMAIARGGIAYRVKKYVDEEFSHDASLEAKSKRINEYMEYLGGEDSQFDGASKIIVPRNYERNV